MEPYLPSLAPRGYYPEHRLLRAALGLTGFIITNQPSDREHKRQLGRKGCRGPGVCGWQGERVFDG